MASLRAADARDIHVAGVGLLRLRPVAPSRAHRFEDRAVTTSGALDVNKLKMLLFQFAVVEPRLTLTEVERVFEQLGPGVDFVLARINEISRAPRTRVDARLPRLHREAARMAATATRARHRQAAHGVARRSRARERRASCSRIRGSRRSRTSSSGSRGDPPDEPEPASRRWSDQHQLEAASHPAQKGGGQCHQIHMQ